VGQLRFFIYLPYLLYMLAVCKASKLLFTYKFCIGNVTVYCRTAFNNHGHGLCAVCFDLTPLGSSHL